MDPVYLEAAWQTLGDVLTATVVGLCCWLLVLVTDEWRQRGW